MRAFRRLGALIAGAIHGLVKEPGPTPPADLSKDDSHRRARSRSPDRFLWPSHPRPARRIRRDRERERRRRQIWRGQLREENGLVRREGAS